MGGFTLVELVVTLVLIGILSISAVARLPDRAGIDPHRLASELRERMRGAQQSALANALAPTELTLEADPDGYRIVTRRGATVLLDRRIETRGVSVAIDAPPAAGQVSAGTPLILTFGALGDLTGVRLGAAPGDPTGGVDLTISGSESLALCVYPTGFTDAQACD